MQTNQQKGGLIPIIKKAVIYNILLLFYILSPSFIAFCLSIFVVSLIFFEDAAQTIIGIVNQIQAEDENSLFVRINSYCKKFNEMSLLMQILMIVCVKVGIDFMWLFPTWLILVIAVEIGIGYDALKSLNMTDKVWELVGQVQGSVQKIAQMIPRYSKCQ